MRVPLLAARLPHPGVPARRRARSSSIRPRSATSPSSQAAIARRGVGPARGEPGPRLPARGRPRPRARSSTPSSRRACSGMPRVGLGAGRRGAARHPPRQGALGRRLVDPPAAPGVAGVRRARCRAARRRARRARGRARRAGQDRDRRARSSTPCCDREAEARARRAVAAALRASTPCAGRATSRSPASSGLAREDYAREIDTAPGPPRARRARSSPPLARCPQTKRDLAAMQGVHRPRQPLAARPLVGGHRGGLRDRRAARRARAPSDSLPPPRAWADRNPEADAPAQGRARRRRPRSPSELDMPVENLLTPDLPAPRRLDSAGADRPRRSVGDALAALGARPWQIDATAQVIADAFVESVANAVRGAAKRAS